MVVIFRIQTGSLWYKKETFSIRNGISIETSLSFDRQAHSEKQGVSLGFLAHPAKRGSLTVKERCLSIRHTQYISSNKRMW